MGIRRRDCHGWMVWVTESIQDSDESARRNSVEDVTLKFEAQRQTNNETTLEPLHSTQIYLNLFTKDSRFFTALLSYHRTAIPLFRLFILPLSPR